MREDEASVLPFWEKLKKNQKDLVCKGSKHLSVKKGGRLVAGSGEYGCFFIKKGSFTVLLLGETGTETELYCVKREDLCLLDYFDVCGQDICDLAYQAATGAEVIAIERDTFYQLLKSCYTFFEKVARGVLITYPVLISSIRQRDYFSLEERIVTLLLNESTRVRSAVLSITHGQIASRIGSAREAVTRKLHDFSEEGLVACSRGKITILNKEKLRKRQSVGE